MRPFGDTRPHLLYVRRPDGDTRPHLFVREAARWRHEAASLISFGNPGLSIYDVVSSGLCFD